MVKAPALSTASQQQQQKAQCPKEIIHQPPGAGALTAQTVLIQHHHTQQQQQHHPHHHLHHHHHHPQQPQQHPPPPQPLFSYPPPLAAATTTTAYYPLAVKKHRRMQMATEPPPVGSGPGSGIVVTKTATTAAIAVVAPTARNALSTCATTAAAVAVVGGGTGGGTASGPTAPPILTLTPSSSGTAVVAAGGMKPAPTLQHQRIQSLHHIHHHHHHQLINGLPGPPPAQSIPVAAAAANAAASATAATWPATVVEPVFHFGPGFELQTRPYCPAHPPSEHVVLFHVRPGVSVTFQIAGNRETVRGPVTLPMVSQNGNPPMAMPMQVPHGHMMQQIVDENGTLRHVILSTQPQQLGQGGVQHHLHPPFLNGTTAPFYSPIASFQTGPGAGAPQMYPPQLLAAGAGANGGSGGAGGGGAGGGTHVLHTPPQGNVTHSPSPPHTNTSYHKDERAQRQYSKLHRKLDQKRSELNASSTPPINSPRKHPEQNGGSILRKAQHPSHHLLPNHVHVVHRNGAVAPTLLAAAAVNVAPSEEELAASAQDEEEESRQAIIVDHLSSVPCPQVTEITSRSALFQWSPPTPSLQPGSGANNGVTEPLPFNVQDLRYEVLLSDHGKENKYKSIFKGESLSCKVQDLRPGQEYTVRLQVYLEQLHGQPTEATVFETPGCEPDVPAPPKLLARTKNSLQLRWNAAVDNGSHIIHYILEYDSGKGSGGAALRAPCYAYDFVEVCKTKGKQFTINKLLPSTYYVFRLSAVNEFGRSGFSDLVKYSTVGSAPAQPAPPTLRQATATALRLAWQRRSQCEEYTLQMNDDQGYGYRNVYTGVDTLYECAGLRRASTFQFRLRAENDNGRGPWSEEVVFRTLPTCPGRPTKPQVKGKVHANSFKVRWDAPQDTGGADIMLYHLEISSGALYERVYSGKESEAMIERLSPGTAYQIRVLCEGPGGISTFSEPCLVTTEPVTPSQPTRPFCKSPPTPYAACLAWEEPDYNGGTPVLEYEMELEANGGKDDDEQKVRSSVYRGKELFCVAKDLQPGGQYAVQVRAINRIGAGPWSEEFRFSAGATAPAAPCDLTIALKSPTHLAVMWTEPPNNGAAIAEYILQSSADPVSDAEFEDTSAAVAALFHTVYRGLNRTADVRNLQPFGRYLFRVAAVNAAGSSRFSVPIGQQMPAAPPNAPAIGEQKITAKSILISWQTPHDHGSPVTQYHIECGDRLITTDAASASEAAAHADRQTTQAEEEEDEEYDASAGAAAGDEEDEDYEEASVGSAASSCDEGVDEEPHEPLPVAGSRLGHLSVSGSPAHSSKSAGHKSNSSLAMATDPSAAVAPNRNMLLIGDLHPETTYKLRIQAVNSIGTGPFSNFIKFTTAPLPPKPPKLECAQAGFAHLKLRWGEGKNLDLARYYVEMENNRTGEFHSVYTGTRTTCKVAKLHELTGYTFRICVESRHAGKGDFSEGFTFTTTAASPNSIKAPRVCVDPATAAAATAPLDMRHGSLTVEWQTSRNNPFSDPIEYILQMAKAKDQDFHQAYRGPESRFTVHNLQYGVSYAFKVCPVRVRQNGDHVSGQFSPVLHHHLTPASVGGGRSASGALGGVAGSGQQRGGNGADEVDGRTMFQGNVVNSRGELILTGKSSAGGLLAGNPNGYGPEVAGHHGTKGGAGGGSAASSTLRQLQQFFEPDSSKAVAFVIVFFLLSIIVAAFLK
ncbi:fibronectin type III domain-containing protein 3B [Anopheles cruzii]|uniref:fibronectin type III domain-containing protein 3B n=1 Tax=Anopheles cruzii TaxID=68878 RepID=UPI0022EC4257|nr:fibronectin type III domain-containing protein 3B [Anopheles cruzii]